MSKLPRLSSNWKTQPQLFERYWDEVTRAIENSLKDITSSTDYIALLRTPQTAGKFFASPVSSTGEAGYRSIDPVDVPILNQNTTGTASNVTGVVAVVNGGTGASTASAARTNLGLATVASSGSYTDLTNKPGFDTLGQATISTTSTLGAGDKGKHLILNTSGITLTFPSSGFNNGEGVIISNTSGGVITFAFPGGSDTGTSFPANASIILTCNGAGFWRQACYSTTRL